MVEFNFISISTEHIKKVLRAIVYITGLCENADIKNLCTFFIINSSGVT